MTAHKKRGRQHTLSDPDDKHLNVPSGYHPEDTDASVDAPLPRHRFECPCGSVRILECLGDVVWSPCCQTCGRPMREAKYFQQYFDGQVKKWEELHL